ncbi:hypothetical protein [Vulgatibacter sp.]|uniref:hypothetical protein n=1 Tax=Vulgatibacter sp. TaxID=1971226 RepID=UPI003564DEF4
MTRLLLLATLALPLLASACSGADCEDACAHTVYDCGWFNDGNDDDRFDQCVDVCRDMRLEDEEKACIADLSCRDPEFGDCFESDRDRKRWPRD